MGDCRRLGPKAPSTDDDSGRCAAEGTRPCESEPRLEGYVTGHVAERPRGRVAERVAKLGAEHGAAHAWAAIALGGTVRGT